MGSLANPDSAPLKLPSVGADSGTNVNLSIQHYLPFAAWYFFLNSFGLPNGLFYSTLLSPFLFLWLYLRGRRLLTARFLLILSPFMLAHIVSGIASPVFYLRSLFLMWTVYITVYAFSWALLNSREIDRLFDELIVLNFCAALFALVALATPLKLLLWDNNSNDPNAAHTLRLRLLTTEPSVYAELMLPLVIFAAIRLLRHSTGRNLLYLILISVPLLLAQSFGGVSIGLASITVSVFFTYRRLLLRPRTLITAACLAAAVAALFLIPNPISDRVAKVATGGDSSTRSRTIYSFIVAYSVAAPKSLWWGVGFGQAKLVDVSDLGVGFDVGIIPNSVAGTLAEFGAIGVLVRFGVEFYLFFRTKVYRNSFRLAMFLAAFITQLTGSHLMDVQQYLMWCLAFLPFFPGLGSQNNSHPRISHS
jgi:hypothetical protein